MYTRTSVYKIQTNSPYIETISHSTRGGKDQPCETEKFTDAHVECKVFWVAHGHAGALQQALHGAEDDESPHRDDSDTVGGEEGAQVDDSTCGVHAVLQGDEHVMIGGVRRVDTGHNWPRAGKREKGGEQDTWI